MNEQFSDCKVSNTSMERMIMSQYSYDNQTVAPSFLLAAATTSFSPSFSSPSQDQAAAADDDDG